MSKPDLSSSLFGYTPRRERLYGLLDAAGQVEIYPSLQRLAPEDRFPIFPGDLGTVLAGHAPYLLFLRQNAVTRTLLDRTISPDRWLFLWSEAGLQALRDHFRGLLLVSTPSLGHALHWRYYDPIVFAAVVPHCDHAQLEHLFGPVSCYRCIDASANFAESYRLLQTGLSTRRETLTPRKRAR